MREKRAARAGSARGLELEGRRLVAAASLAAVGLICGGCLGFGEAAVGVEEVGQEVVHRSLNQNVVESGTPSAVAHESLHQLFLEEAFDAEPNAALAEMHRIAVLELDRDLVYALAELSFAAAKRLGSRDHYLAAAVYAYLFLLDEELGELPNPYDRRFRWACDLYNVGLHQAFGSPEGPELRFEGETRRLPVGSLSIRFDRSRFPWSEEQVARFRAADDFLVFGLSLRYRRSGLGLPLVSLRNPIAGEPSPVVRYSAVKLSIPATAFLRLAGGLRELEQGMDAAIELYSAYDGAGVQLGDRTVPLESDLSTALAYTLNESDVWKSSLRGFFHADEDENVLAMVMPYKPGRIPVVFVHGTASNPGYWAEMLNTLWADPDLRERFQPWVFRYNTGNPMAYSAATLRRSLLDIVKVLDPEERDSALRHMVLIGHSQGGLLAKLQVVDGDLGMFQEIAGAPYDEFRFTPDQEKLIREVIDFDPVPEVGRVIFVCTPHKGSFLAERRFSGWLKRLIAVPSAMVDFGQSVREQQERLPPEMRWHRVPTSLDSMDWRNPIVRMVSRMPIVPGVKVHSIVAVKGDGPVEEGDDGVVDYSSAHLDAADSELVVRSPHSCQSHPQVIREVRRILLEHLQSLEQP